MSTYSPQTLGWWMDERRGELALTWQQVADEAGVSTETLYRVAEGRRMRTTTKKGVERALRWQPGSIDAVLHDREPAPLAAEPERSPRPADPVAEPRPEDYPDEHEYMNAVYWYLRRGMGMSHEAVMRGFDMAAAIYKRKNAERDVPKAPGNKVG